MTATLKEICRYPVKGLSADRIEAVTLTSGAGVPDDRRFALAHGSARIDAGAPEWRPKSDFLTLVRNARLAKLETRFDGETGTLAIHRGGGKVVEGDATSPLGRALIEQFFAAFMGDEARGGVRLVEAGGFMFSDVPEAWVSIINLESVRDLERVTGAPVDPVRFRGNLIVAGGHPWSEHIWVGQEITVGDARLKVHERIGRCAATEVNPATAERDMQILMALTRGFDHTNMGVYAEVVEGAGIKAGDPVALV
ncbi:MAG TPA: MOSC domain-containing protein [Alphaproteobacteria bacterium]|nr:MOSC domain-containing protein [Alphaproteobacteria bacterium]